MVSIENWLGGHGLGKYSKSFVKNDIDIDVLTELTNNDLKELGLSLGDRKRFLSAVENLPRDNFDSRNDFKTASISTAEAEHRNLTILFSDLVGSTELSVDLDPESLRKINRDYQDIVTSSVEQFGGYVARYMGDGVLAYFGYPQAYEDDPHRAVRSALEIVSTFQSMKSNIAPGISHQTKVRVGIETGPVVVGDVIGEGASRESPVVGETLISLPASRG
jgi:class 3 adenylate cyclase